MTAGINQVAQDSPEKAGQECFAAALDYKARGWSPLALCPPDHCGVGEAHGRNCGSHGKAPWGPWKKFQDTAASVSELERKWRDNPQLNVGMALGPVCGLVGLDIDGPGGEKLLQEMSGGALPATLEFRRGPGRRLLYRIPDREIFRTTPHKGNGKHEEVRFLAKGAQSVMPPSRHISGDRYQWVEGHAPGQIEPALAPDWLVKRMRERTVTSNGRATHSKNGELRKPINPLIKRAIAYLAKCAPAIAGQNGHSSCMAAARAIVWGFDIGPTVGYDLLAEHYNPRCQPPWSDEELRHKCEEADQAPFDKPRGYLLDKTGEDIHLTDLGNAKRVVNAYGDDLKYCYPWKQFLVWNNVVWQEDSTGEAVRCVKNTQAALYRDVIEKLKELRDAGDDEERKGEVAKLMKVLQHALKWEGARQITACLDLVKSEKIIPILPKDLDKDLFLFNVRNGTVNLKTGQLQPHRREDFITKLASVEYDASASCPLWKKCLDRWMDGNGDLIDYLQRVVGMSLTGDVSEQALWFFHGGGANGKSTFLLVLLHLFGDYGMQAVSDLLIQKRNESHPTERADLFGKRFVATIETEQGKHLAEALMKQLTGSDKLTARKLYKDFFSFDQTHKIFLAANHKPQVRGTDHANWRRIKLVPWDVTITEEEKDKHLVEKLKEELSGILNWAIEGCMQWQRNGLGEPDEVRLATNSYRAEQDTLAQFIQDRCFVHHDHSVRVRHTDFYDAYLEWSGEKNLPPHGLKAMMEAKCYVSAPGKGNARVWLGIALRNDNEPEDMGSLG